MSEVSTVQPSEATARVVKDSINRHNDRLITVVGTLARSALAELNTHRTFARNSASSRAIPVQRMLASVMNDPFVPRRFSLNRPGMNAGEFVSPGDERWEEMLGWWIESRDTAVRQAERGMEMGLHKQDVNRLLEPYMQHTVIISATEWTNFFDQRLALDEDGHPLAYLPIYDFALAIKEAIKSSTPVVRDPDLGSYEDSWHLPLLGPQDEGLTFEEKKKVSIARCARVSYFDINGERRVEYVSMDPAKDLTLYGRLEQPSNSSAPHLSPFEHVARALPGQRYGNFQGWRQARQDLEAKMRGMRQSQAPAAWVQ